MRSSSRAPSQIAAVSLLVLAALLLRASGLERQSLWLDEFLAFSIGQSSFPELLRLSQGIHGQSPFYYVVVKGWTALFGRDDVTVIRSLSVALGMLSLLQAYAFARRFAGPSHAAVTLAILAFSPFHLYFSQEARMYPLLMVEILAAAHLILSALRCPAARTLPRWAGLAVVSTCALYTHYYAVLFLSVLGLLALLSARSDPAVFRGVAGAYGAAALLYLPWLPAVIEAARSGGNSFIQYAELKGLYTLLTFSLGYSSVVIDAPAKRDLIGTFLRHGPLLAAGAASFGWLFLSGLRALWRRDRQLFQLVALVLVLPITAATLISLRLPIISERYFTPALPFFALVLAFGVLAGRGWRKWVPTAAAAVLITHSLWNYHANPRFGHHDWRRAAEIVETAIGPGEEIVLYPDYVAGCFRFYAGDEHPMRSVSSPRQLAGLPADRSYWLVSSHGRRLDEVVAAFEDRFARSRHELLPRGEGISIYRFEPRRRLAGGRRAEGGR